MHFPLAEIELILETEVAHARRRPLLREPINRFQHFTTEGAFRFAACSDVAQAHGERDQITMLWSGAHFVEPFEQIILPAALLLFLLIALNRALEESLDQSRR